MSVPQFASTLECHDLNRVEDPRDIVYRAVAALAQGEPVAFSLAGVQGIAASSLHPTTVDRLEATFPATSEPGSYSLLLKGAEELADWVPDLGQVGSRLSRRLWPGETTLIVPVSTPGGLLDYLAPSVRDAVTRGCDAAFQTPRETFLRDTLRLVAGPVLLRAFSEPDTADEASFSGKLTELGVRLLIEAGTSGESEDQAVVRIDGDRWSLLRPGGLDERTLTRLAATMILFVCTGNTCRSPMAEALCKVLISERLKCPIADLESRGYVVLSAGIAAMTGMPAAAHAIEVVKARGGSLREHASRKLSPDLIGQADLILAMTHDHLNSMLEHAPEAGSRALLLHPVGDDVADPVGADRETYQRTARAIESYLVPLLDRLGI